ncbi:MAG: tetratricopeptide repeat protein [Pseudorhodoplanes sp.]
MIHVVRLAAVAAALLIAPAVSAQTVEPSTPPEPPKNLPSAQGGDRTKNLDALFAALKAAPDEDTAKAIEGRIWALWLVSTSDTANLLMSRVRQAIEAKDTELAMRLLNAIIEIRPDYVEAWNRRATLRYLQKDFGAALADIRQVLRREPRHFGALTGLGMILQEFGEDKSALAAFRRATEVHPKLQKVPDMIKTLAEKVEGRDI